jgi:integrase
MSIKIVYRPVKKTDSKGFLKIRIIENRKTTFKSLGIKISGKNWLDDKQRVSKSEKDADQINEKIIEVLRDLSKHDAPSQAIQTTNKTILAFYDEIISTTINNGTRLKYVDIRNRFEKYLNENGYKDLKFIQLTPQHVLSFHQYIRNTGSTVNTANYNLKSFKSIINKAIKIGLVNYTNDPFGLLVMKFTPKQNKTLTPNEVSNLISATFKDHRKTRYNNLGVSLEEFRDIFLFQLFTQGLRCSDVQLLRWSDFKSVDGVILMDYTQYKTKKPMRLKMTLIGLKMLNARLDKLDESFNHNLWLLEEKKERFRNLLDNQLQRNEERSNLEEKQEIINAWNKVKDVYSNTPLDDFKKLYDDKSSVLLLEYCNKNIALVESEIYNLYIKTIKGVIENNPNGFVFHFLKNEDFSNYKSGADLTELQYKRLTGTRHYYNNILKEIAKQCDISTTLTSHVARHTYTQLLLDNNADLTAVSQSLGHSNIATTQTYIKQLPNNKLLGINEVLSSTFN